MKVHPTAGINTKNTGLKVSKLLFFRISVFFSLFTTASLCGFFAYWILNNEEQASFENHYESVSSQIHHSIIERLTRAQSAGDELATMQGIYHSNSSFWPYAFVKGYDDIHKHMAKLSNLITVGVAPIVKPEEVVEYENYVRSIYQSEPFNFNATNLDVGIFGRTEDGQPFHDTTGESPTSNRALLTPILLAGDVRSTYSVLNYNLHSEEARGEAIDASYDCALATGGSCSAMTDIISLFNAGELRPNSLLFRPIYPFDDRLNAVGFQIVSVSWEILLKGIVPDFVCGVETVLSTDTQKYTYSLCNGDVKLKCDGDCHAKKFNSDVLAFDLNSSNDEIIQPHCYKMKIYPTQTFYDNYHSNNPWICSIAVVLIILLTSCIFVTYDFFVKKDSDAKQQVLEAKRKFVRFVSHEIRTPLNTLVLGLKLLIENIYVQVTDLSIQKKLSELAKELRGSCDVAVMVLNDLLHYDKIETGNLNLDLKPLQIWKLINRSVQLFRGSARENQVTLIEDLAGLKSDENYSNLGINGDILRISQVIGNIISNAIKFSPVGSTVVIKSECIKEQHLTTTLSHRGNKAGEKGKYHMDEWVVFSVQDHGPGMSKANLQKLFGEGVQFNPNELQSGQGSGLGLWISKGIIELHGGRIWATSEGEGKGSTFFFQLPLIEMSECDLSSSEINDDSFHQSIHDRNNSLGQLGSKARTARSSDVNTVTTSIDSRNLNFLTNENTSNSSKKLSILIVDDVAICRRMLRRSLESKGFECLEAENGRECVDTIVSGVPVDCILMDNQMPVLCGPEATRELREKACWVPVVGVTGNVMSEDIDAFMSAGVDLVMQKPFQMEVFEKYVKENLNR